MTTSAISSERQYITLCTQQAAIGLCDSPEPCQLITAGATASDMGPSLLAPSHPEPRCGSTDYVCTDYVLSVVCPSFFSP